MVVKEFGWLSKPRPEHIVQFYQSDGALLTMLAEYVSRGMECGDTCIIIATPSHLRDLDALLLNRGLDTDAAKQSGQYVAIDAAAMLNQFMIKSLPDRTRFFQIFQSATRESMKRNKPIRFYGEMVALLWRDGKKDAVIQLEELWNELIKTYAFALFCAYPDLHFIMDNDIRTEICNCHQASLPSSAATPYATS